MASASKPKVLVFIDWYYPGYRAGGPIRSIWNMINSLHKSVDFYVITRNTDYMSNVPYANIVPDTWQQLSDGHKVWYCSARKANSKAFLKAANQIGEFDVIYINGVFSSGFSITPARLVKKRMLRAKRHIIAPRGMFAPDALRIKGLKKRLFLTMAKLSGLYSLFSWHVTNSKEAAQVKKIVGSTQCFVIPNLIDRGAIEKLRNIEKVPGKLRLVSVARIAPEKNLLFALERLSEIQQGEIHLDVYGSVYSEAYKQQCLDVCERLPASITVAFCGETPNDSLVETLQPYHALILPTLGENFGHIIAESLMANLPVIISNRTPWNEIEQVGAGWVFPLEDLSAWTKTLTQLCQMTETDYHSLCNSVYTYIVEKTKQDKDVALYGEMFVM